MASWLLLIAVVAVAGAQQPADIDPALLTELFGTPENPYKPAPSGNGGDLGDLDVDKLFPKNPPGGGGTHGGGGDLSGGSGGSLVDCVCVSYFLCNNGSINTDGTGIIDIRIDDTDGPCGTYLETCCNPKDVQVSTTTSTTPRSTGDGGDHSGGDYHPDPSYDRKPCGYRNADGVGFRIREGEEAQFGEFPWMIAVMYEEVVEADAPVLNVYQCGGALIHPGVVVTAAHCVIGSQKRYKARAGEWDTQTKKELYPHQDRNVKDIVTHKDYYSGGLHNDIALLFLEEPFDIAENVNTLCLPPQNALVDNTRCVASGWGKNEFGKEGKYQVILKKIDLPVVNRGRCQDQLRTTRLGRFFELHESFMCAGGEKGVDTCKGDGGSPLVCPVVGKPNIYQHVGIVAWGIGCGNEIPGVYVNVAKFRHWIDDHMTKRGLDTTWYTT